MGLLKKIFGRPDAVGTDARRIYVGLMAQSRMPAFYEEFRFGDSYDGRIDVLTLHIAAILSNLKRFGQNGERLGQALFDEMKDDFEIALREEALSDAGVKKRIQPMISLFYDRVKKYAEALNEDNPKESLRKAFAGSLKGYTTDAPKAEIDSSANVISTYLSNFDANLSKLSLGQIALTEFEFPIIQS